MNDKNDDSICVLLFLHFIAQVKIMRIFFFFTKAKQHSHKFENLYSLMFSAKRLWYSLAVTTFTFSVHRLQRACIGRSFTDGVTYSLTEEWPGRKRRSHCPPLPRLLQTPQSWQFRRRSDPEEGLTHSTYCNTGFWVITQCTALK